MNFGRVISKLVSGQYKKIKERTHLYLPILEVTRNLTSLSTVIVSANTPIMSKSVTPPSSVCLGYDDLIVVSYLN